MNDSKVLTTYYEKMKDYFTTQVGEEKEIQASVSICVCVFQCTVCMCLSIRLRALVPVSYTHLDVYKRQAYR